MSRRHRMPRQTVGVVGRRLIERQRNHEIGHDLSQLCLAHIEGPRTVRAYARGHLLEKRMPVMRQWADYLDECA